MKIKIFGVQVQKIMKYMEEEFNNGQMAQDMKDILQKEKSKDISECIKIEIYFTLIP